MKWLIFALALSLSTLLHAQKQNKKQSIDSMLAYKNARAMFPQNISMCKRFLHQAIKLDPSFIDPYLLLYFVHEINGEIDEARKVLKDALANIKLSRQKAIINIYLARLYYKYFANYEYSLQLLNESLAFYPDFLIAKREISRINIENSKRLPYYTIITTDGEILNISDITSPYIIIVFFTPDNYFSTYQLDIIGSGISKSKKSRVEVIAISLGGDKDDIDKIASRGDYEFKFSLDNQGLFAPSAIGFGAYTIPFVIVANENRDIIYSKQFISTKKLKAILK